MCQVYAAKGEAVTCERGHVICRFARTVWTGELFNPADLAGWQQPRPEIGTSPVCLACGAAWLGGPGTILHFANGWRAAGERGELVLLDRLAA